MPRGASVIAGDAMLYAVVSVTVVVDRCRAVLSNNRRDLVTGLFTGRLVTQDVAKGVKHELVNI